jgi:hypothetical protein
LHHQIFAKVKCWFRKEKSHKNHDTNNKDLRIFKNSGGTVLPLIAGGDRGGKSKKSSRINISMRKKCSYV